MNLFSRIALDPLRSGIPVDHVSGGIEHENGVVGDAFHQKPEAAFAFLKLEWCWRRAAAARSAAPSLKRAVQVLQLSSASFRAATSRWLVW